MLKFHSPICEDKPFFRVYILCVCVSQKKHWLPLFIDFFFFNLLSLLTFTPRSPSISTCIRLLASISTSKSSPLISMGGRGTNASFHQNLKKDALNISKAKKKIGGSPFSFIILIIFLFLSPV